MAAGLSNSSAPRVVVDGKFFRLAGRKFHPKGVTYGPFEPGPTGDTFPTPSQARADVAQILALGANVVRVYHVPPRWFLDLAAECGLKLLVDVPWNKHLCFLDYSWTRAEARDAIRQAAQNCAMHPAVWAISVVNEIPPDVVRWSGPEAVAAFIDELAALVRAVDPDCLVTFGNFPPTEYLRPQTLDFVCFNVYLHERRPFENYLARLQMIADARPLVLGEFGLDTLREGEDRQAETLAWQIEAAFRGGVAGAIVFSFTDDWVRPGGRVEDWAFGLTRRDREPKPSYAAVQRTFGIAPLFPLDRYPKVSVVVACYNGARTLKACLDSLLVLNYPSYEVLLVDDGSTDSTAQIGSLYPTVRVIRHEQNAGLSVARNTGIEAATGEIVAFTDADCRADEDWLHYVVGSLLGSDFAGIGGHNLLPADDSYVAAAVMVSPGGPAHVMLSDRLAEHIPGCNMSFYRWALLETGCFDPIFRTAGDDVDLCWRMQERGLKLGFSPAGFVWHYRRSTVGEYLKQQRGYGDAEALLIRKHPEYFNWAGGSLWHGRIYSPARYGVTAGQPMIYHGLFGTGLFQTLYTPPPAAILSFFTTFEYYVLAVLPLLVLALAFGLFIPLALTSALIPLGVAATAAAQAQIAHAKRRFWSRPLVSLLFFLQPIVRGWARYRGHLSLSRVSLETLENLDSLSKRYAGHTCREAAYWNERGMERPAFVATIRRRLDQKNWPYRTDTGWNHFDLEISGSRWCRLQLLTVGEVHGAGRRLFRCRLQARWSLLSHVVFWALTAAELLLVGILGGRIPFLWAIWATLPIMIWWLHRQKMGLQRVMAAFLDGIAEQLRLEKMDPRSGRS